MIVFAPLPPSQSVSTAPPPLRRSSRIYRKLDIRSRGELARLVADGAV